MSMHIKSFTSSSMSFLLLTMQLVCDDLPSWRERGEEMLAGPRLLSHLPLQLTIPSPINSAFLQAWTILEAEYKTINTQTVKPHDKPHDKVWRTKQAKKEVFNELCLLHSMGDIPYCFIQLLSGYFSYPTISTTLSIFVDWKIRLFKLRKKKKKKNHSTQMPDAELLPLIWENCS